MSAFYNSLGFTLPLEIKTCVRDPSSFACQVPRFTSRIDVHVFYIVLTCYKHAVCSLQGSLLLAVKKYFDRS